MKSIAELNLGCGKKENKEMVTYYKSQVDNVEQYTLTCTENQLCEECLIKIETISEVVKLINNALDIDGYGEFLKKILVNGKETK